MSVVRNEAPAFVPAVVESDPSDPPVPVLPQSGAAEGKSAPVLELEIDGASVWVWREAEVSVVMAVVRALKHSR